jgi:pilus assembly protein Flp/PilA
MLFLAKIWNWFKSDERGQGLAEYGLIIILVAAIVVGAIAVFRESILDLFGRDSDQLSSP